jgi:hypothetical protein
MGLVEFLVQLVLVAILVGWVLIKSPDRFDHAMPWIMLAILWYITWKYFLCLQGVKQQISVIGRKLGRMSWMLAFLFGGMISTVYWFGIEKSLGAISNKHSESKPLSIIPPIIEGQAATSLVPQEPLAPRSDVTVQKPSHSPKPTGAQAPLPQPQVQQADHGFINNAPNFGSQKVEDNRQYGVPKPPPTIVGLVVQAIPPIPRPTMPVFSADTPEYVRRQQMSQYKQQIFTGEPGPSWNPGLSLSFRVATQFSNPMFEVHCDRPCIATSIFFSSNGVSVSTGGLANPSLFSTDDPRVVRFGSGMRQLLTPDVTVVLTIRSQDDKAISHATVEPFVQ